MNLSNNKTTEPGTSLQEKKNVSRRFYAAFGIGALIVISFASAFAGYVFYQKNSALRKEAQALQQESDSLRQQLEDARVGEQGLKIGDVENTVGEEKLLSDSFSIKDHGVVIQSVRWQDRAEIPSFKLFSGKLSGDGLDREKVAHYYKMGTITSMGYHDYDIILVSTEEVGMGGTYVNLYRFVARGDERYLLEWYSNELTDYDQVDRTKFGSEISYAVISDLEPPQKIAGPKERQRLLLGSGPNAFFSDRGLVKVFTDSLWGDVYTDAFPVIERDFVSTFGVNGFYMPLKDGTVAVYRYEVDFMKENGSGNSGVPDITWNNGDKNTEGYVSTDIGGCGSANYISVITEDVLNPATDLSQTGVNSFGDAIYELKNTSHPILKEYYKKNDFVLESQKKLPYNEFTAHHPMFFWRDPFGRLIKFTNDEFVPSVECGKPVIYLYPEKTTDVSVKINPKGGLRYSEPEYAGGWEVVANPDGRLIETKTGNIYPYLFWEGRGGLYETPKKGFSVARGDVHLFLTAKLGDLGLNEKEVADFMEYWEPYMQNAPYYFITFVDKRVIDELAPLSVSPKPDTVIRILMDFLPLNAPIVVDDFSISTPVRRGFTVVEWGGVKR